MKHQRQLKKFRARANTIPCWLCLAAVILTVDRSLKLLANPTGMTVVSGSGRAQQAGSQLNVTVSQTAILNWSSFNIKAGETTTFLQPSANSVVFNQIGDANPSQIFGNLNANGTVILANANGFYFGPNSMISVGGSFIATTAPLTPDFGAGSAWQFSGMPPLASIVNYGQIKVGTGKSLYLIAEQIDNHGELAAPGGDIGLYAGQNVLVSERPDGRGLSATMTVSSGSVNNFGQITAGAGTIALQAQVVNQNGIIQANSVQNKNGVIELVASDTVNLGTDSQILARGDDSSPVSSGGNVTLKAGNNFSDAVGSQIVTTGGIQGGNGGSIEVSAPTVSSLDSIMDARAQTGWLGGTFFLDPVNIILGTSTAGGAINVNTAFAGFSSIQLQATGNISLNTSTTWNLSASTGITAGQLTLQAGGDIIFNNSAKITDANNWSVTLDAGYDFGNNSINSGTGNIYLNGGAARTFNGAIQTASGSVNLQAGQSILVGSGSVYTTGGGSIFASALAGDINAGTANGGYQFTIFGYSPVATLGGISTAAGGDVTLMAGNIIISQPTVPANQSPGASGAYGSQPGNVTLIAGNQILGNYTLANGVGTILAGVQVQNGQVTKILNPAADVGSSTRPVNLSLIDGSWNVWAANSIYVGEVRNPNGTFNPNKIAVPSGQYAGNLDNPTVPAKTPFYMDYAADAAVNLWAGNGISLLGQNLPRLTGYPAAVSGPIYAPILTLDAGAGGVTIGNSIILFPSSQGALQITTRDGGNLVGTAQGGSLSGITMSDSGLPDIATFGQGHATTPMHLNDPNPVRLDISGSIENFALTVPTFAQINVAGDTYNFGFLGRNLSPAQTTAINVAGNITDRGNLTSVGLTDLLPLFLFDPALSGNPSVAGRLRYDATAGTLTFVGVMSAQDLSFLLNPTKVQFYADGSPILQLGADGKPILDQFGNTIPVTTPVTLDATQLSAIQQLYAASQSATLGDQGLTLAGPGTFKVTGQNIDLGISGGISVIGPDAALAAISLAGANLDVTTSGNLDLTSTKIANESLLGGISLNVGGALDVGGQFSAFGDPSSPKGIFTTGGGNISVTTSGDVNVNGSRIAAYNGGNVAIESLNGDVNAGAGGAGYVTLKALELDPTTHQLVGIPATIPGSGILATTVAGSHATLGSINVNTPNGSINASSGGILQIAFNGADTQNSFVNLTAGLDILATGSGVIGANVNLTAVRTITGLFIAKNTLNAAADNFGPGLLFGPAVAVNQTGDSSGGLPIQVVSDNPISANGVEITPTAPEVASAPTQVAQTAEDATAVADTADGLGDDADDEKKKKKPIALAQKVSRVTVLLPTKTN